MNLVFSGELAKEYQFMLPSCRSNKSFHLRYLNLYRGYNSQNEYRRDATETATAAPFFHPQKETNMNTALFNPASTSQVSSGKQASWGLLTELGCQQLAVFTEIASTFFRSSESIRKIQQQAAHHASLRHEAATKKLRSDCTPADLLGIQAELLRFDTAEASQYWQQLAATAQQAQAEMMTCTSHMPNSQLGNNLQSTLNAFQATLPLVNGFFASSRSRSIE